MKNNINILVDIATQFQFHAHLYVEKVENSNDFALSTRKNLADLSEFIQALGNQDDIPLLSFAEKRHVTLALEIIESNLNKKINGLFYRLFTSRNRVEQVTEIIQHIQKVKEQYHTRRLIIEGCHDEVQGRLKFYRELPKKLSVKKAARNDLEAIKRFSKVVWERSSNYEEYEKYMLLKFVGEHMIFEEKHQDSHGYEIYESLRAPSTTAYLRKSSHYDHGTTNGKLIGQIPTQHDMAQDHVNPQYEVTGPQIKALLIGRVKLALDEEGKPIFGKTFEQVREHALKYNLPLPTRYKKYTFIQAEWAPDNSSPLSINFWKHRIFSFTLYVSRKILRFEKPNVGPYGYGHADCGKDGRSHPTVIPYQRSR